MEEKKNSKPGILNHKADILLINPPFGPSTNPYIAIPVLASYLKSRDIKVEAYDLNREFFCRLLTPQRIQEGIEYCLQRFDQLNSKPELDFQQVIEMRHIVHIFMQFHRNREDIKTLSQPFADFDLIRRSPFKHMFTIASTMRYFPEFIMTNPFTIAMSVDDPFSSQHIINSVSRCDFYTNIFEEIIKEELSGRIPNCVGFSIPFSYQVIPAFQCAGIIKKMAPETHITMGGPWISIFLRETKVAKFFDIVDSFIMDEGEIPLEVLTRELRKKTPELKNVPGLVYLTEDKICKNSLPPPVDIENSPPPDYSFFQLDKYFSPSEHMTLSFRLSRGCYWKKCTFCRTRLPMTCDFQKVDRQVVYKHLRHMIEQTKTRNIFFSDDSSDLDVLEYISQNLIKDNIKISWRAHARISSRLTKQKCLLFKEAGCIQLNFGIESFSDRILNLMKKGISVEMIDKVLEEINGVIPVGAYMIVGYPSETEAEAVCGYKKVMAHCAAGLITYHYYNMFSMIYGSDIWNNPEAHGIYDIRVLEGQDLPADIYDFKSSGMTREKAFLLFKEFSETDRFIKNLKYGQLYIGEVAVPIRFDLAQTLEMDNKNWQAVYMPFARWLRELNKTFTPLKPLTPV